jgi:choline dehydrogenase-like flavoprotein
LAAYDLIVIGSGFGGALAAAPAVRAGRRVLMIEAGDWVPRGPHNWTADGFADRAPFYSHASAFEDNTPHGPSPLGTYLNVGGASVVYGGVGLRLRQADFEPITEIDGQSGAVWPYRYAELEPYYAQAEQWLGVSGDATGDPTAPPRSTPFPHPPAPLAPISKRLAEAATSLGLRPFRLPLAINYTSAASRTPCVACGTCDGYACAINAKNDIATVLLPRLLHEGLELATNTVAVRLQHEQGRVSRVVCVRQPAGDVVAFEARAVVVAAGALASPRLLLASRLDAVNPAGDAIGRYLTRHCNAVVLGVFPRRPAPSGEFHKQIAIHDYYFGHPTIPGPEGRLGTLQQWGTPAPWVTHERLPLGLGTLIGPALAFTTGFIVMAEDRPQASNRVRLTSAADIDAATTGVTPATVDHAYHARDLAARAALVGAARRILRRAGALFSVAQNVETYSHALGTVRMGPDPRTAPLDGWGAFRGLDNLYVTDGSALPRSGGVNPSLTIAANALRTGTYLVTRL